MDKLIAHRGYKKNAQENTLKAFNDALLLGYGGIECDVRMTSDGQFIIFHDALLNGKLVKNISLKEAVKQGITTLEEVLSLKTDKMIVLDLKDPFLDTLKLHELLIKHSPKIYVMSFYSNLIRKLASYKRTYEIGILNFVINTQKDHFTYDFFCVMESFLNNNLIIKYQKNNKKLFVYATSNNIARKAYPYYIVD